MFFNFNISLHFIIIWIIEPPETLLCSIGAPGPKEGRIRVQEHLESSCWCKNALGFPIVPLRT